VRYYFIRIVILVCGLFMLLGVRFVWVGTAIVFSSATESYFGKASLLIGYIPGMIAAGIAFAFFSWASSFLDRWDEKAKALRSNPYTERYGDDYPQPKISDFGITDEEFREYNSRFQFSDFKGVFTYSPMLYALYRVFKDKFPLEETILFFSVAISLGIALNYILDYVDDRISKGHRHHRKISKYQEAIHIYHKIQRERFLSF
jgi:hypothetical protein